MKVIIDIDEQHFELLQMAVMNGMGDNAQKIIAQGIPLEQMLEQITAEIYEHFMTIDGKVYDASAIKCMEIIGKYKAERSDKE